MAPIKFQGSDIQVFQDLSPITLQRRRNFRVVTDKLREENIRYKWGFPFLLSFRYKGSLHSSASLEDACKVLQLEYSPQMDLLPSRRKRLDESSGLRNNWEHIPQKPRSGSNSHPFPALEASQPEEA